MAQQILSGPGANRAFYAGRDESSSDAIAISGSPALSGANTTDAFYFFLADDGTTSNIIPQCGTAFKSYIYNGSVVTLTDPEQFVAADWSGVDAVPLSCGKIFRLSCAIHFDIPESV